MKTRGAQTCQYARIFWNLFKNVKTPDQQPRPMKSQPRWAGHEHQGSDAPSDSSLTPAESILCFLSGVCITKLPLRLIVRTESKNERKALREATGTYCLIECPKNILGFTIIKLFLHHHHYSSDHHGSPGSSRGSKGVSGQNLKEDRKALGR